MYFGIKYSAFSIFEKKYKIEVEQYLFDACENAKMLDATLNSSITMFFVSFRLFPAMFITR